MALWIKHKSNNKLSDQDLLSAYQQEGDTSHLSVLFDRYLDMIYGTCLYYLKTEQDAKDACMEVYQHLQKKLPHQQIENFRPWLSITTKNYCLGILRKYKKNLTQSFDPTVMHLSESLHPIDDNDDPRMDDKELKKCMENLPDEQQAAIYSFYYEQLSYELIAQSMHQTVNKIRSYMQNGRRNLKICLERHHGK